MFWLELDTQGRVRFTRLVGTGLRVRGWVLHYTYENPHKDKSTRICVCVFVYGRLQILALSIFVLPRPCFIPNCRNPIPSLSLPLIFSNPRLLEGGKKWQWAGGPMEISTNCTKDTVSLHIALLVSCHKLQKRLWKNVSDAAV